MASTATCSDRVLRALLPSFVSDALFPHDKLVSRVHPTSYLDGLRGLASMIVFFCHYTEENHKYLVPAYGLNQGDGPSAWIQLPFLRAIFSGRPMVHIFFVISGFALSYKPLQAIHARQLEKCFSILSSSTFRRPIRLFLPCIVETFMVMVLVQAGWLYDPDWLYHALPTFSAQFSVWTDAVLHSTTWPWSWDDTLPWKFDPHLWSIPIEFAHSLLLFVVIMMLSRVTLRIRQSVVVGLMAYCMTCGKWAAFEFLGGMFLAELHLLKAERPKDWESSELTPSPRRPAEDRWMGFRLAFHLSLIVWGIFVGGWPNSDWDKTPGIRWYLSKTPKAFEGEDRPQKFWFALSAVLTVWSCGELRFIRRFLENKTSQYCGRISFALYIVHGPVLALVQEHIIGHMMKPAEGEANTPDFHPAVPGYGLKGHFGTATPTARTICWFFGLLGLGPIIIWVADIFWRAVDKPVIALARWLETLCLDEPKDEEPGALRRGIY